MRGALVVAVSVLALPMTALAQPKAEDLFASGLESMKRGDYAAACPAIAESYRLDPLPGALFTLAECEARGGKVASAWTHFGEFLAITQGLDQPSRERQAERIAAAESRRRVLEKQLSRLKLVLPADTPISATLEDNGAPVATERWSEPLLVDPGVHRLVLRLPTGERTEVVNVERGREYLVRFAEPAPAPAPRPLVSPAPRTRPRVASQPHDASERGPSAAWVGGWVSLGLGAAGLATAAGVGIVLLSKKDAIADNCVEARCNPAGFEAAEDVSTLDVVGTTAFVVGAVGTVLGVSLLIVDSTVSAKSDGRRAMLSWDMRW